MLKDFMVWKMWAAILMLMWFSGNFKSTILLRQKKKQASCILLSMKKDISIRKQVLFLNKNYYSVKMRGYFSPTFII